MHAPADCARVHTKDEPDAYKLRITLVPNSHRRFARNLVPLRHAVRIADEDVPLARARHMRRRHDVDACRR